MPSCTQACRRSFKHAHLQAHVQKPPDEPISRLDESEAFKAVLLRALQKKPGDRYQTAREMAAALAPFARTPAEETNAASSPDSDSQALASLAPDAAFAIQSRDSQIIDADARDGSQRRRYLVPLVSLCLVAGALAWFFMGRPAPTPPTKQIVVPTSKSTADVGPTQTQAAPDAATPPATANSDAATPVTAADAALSPDVSQRNAEPDAASPKPKRSPRTRRSRSRIKRPRTARPTPRSAPTTQVPEAQPEPPPKKNTSPKGPTVEEF